MIHVMDVQFNWLGATALALVGVRSSPFTLTITQQGNDGLIVGSGKFFCHRLTNPLPERIRLQALPRSRLGGKHPADG
jgi:hypothetical protein